METRKITTDDGAAWSLAEAAQSDGPEGTATVVATPSGGEQTVRLTLPAAWRDLDDAEMAQAVERARAER